MKTLVIDASYKQTVAILENDKLIETRYSTDEKADTMLKLISDLLTDNNYKIRDIDQIAVNIGPGSFTGIRVAVSLAKGLGYGRNIKFLTFDSFDYFSSSENVVLTGFSNYVYVSCAHGEKKCVLLEELDKDLKYVTDSENLKNKLSERGYKVTQKNKLAFYKIDEIVNGKPLLASEIKPLYLRASQAEIDREKKLGGKK